MGKFISLSVASVGGDKIFRLSHVPAEAAIVARCGALLRNHDLYVHSLFLLGWLEANASENDELQILFLKR